MATNIVPGNYKRDLTEANEHVEPCANHPGRRAIACDLDRDNQKIPLCEDCYRAAYPRIRQRLAEQRLILGGLKERAV